MLFGAVQARGVQHFNRRFKGAARFPQPKRKYPKRIRGAACQLQHHASLNKSRYHKQIRDAALHFHETKKHVGKFQRAFCYASAT
jgi:hypothetical protein